MSLPGLQGPTQLPLPSIISSLPPASLPYLAWTKSCPQGLCICLSLGQEVSSQGCL